MPVPLVAETSQTIVSPPQSSGASSRSCNCFFTRSMFAEGKSILLMATMILTCGAAFAWLIASIVCGMARRVEKRDVRALVIDGVGADMLGDAARFARGNARLADRVH